MEELALLPLYHDDVYCERCGRPLPPDMFTEHAGRRTGRDMCRDCRKRYVLDTNYWMELEEYVGLEELAGGECENAACRRPLSAIDHDHMAETELGIKYVNGLLCAQCNYAKGLLLDSPALCEGLARFLRERGLLEGGKGHWPAAGRYELAGA